MSLDGINGWSIQKLLRGENDSKQSDEFQAKQLLMYPRFEYCGSETIHCIEFVIGSQSLLQECFSGSHSNKYVSYCEDWAKHPGHQVKVTDVKRWSFCTLQENIQCS